MAGACTALLFSAARGGAAEPDALRISANIQARHTPFGLTVLDPVYAASTSDQIVGYTRAGDSAIWTGHYLAAEAFRYQVTRSPDALANVTRAIAGLKSLSDVTGDNLLGRCIVWAASPFAAGIQSEESNNGIHPASPWFWIGNTSRDQFIGAIFGLAVAYDMVDDLATKNSISDLVTRLIHFLTFHNWSVVQPDGSIITTFLVRPDQILALVQIGRHVNPNQFSAYYDDQRGLYADTRALDLPLSIDASSNDSYFKFNLDYINLFNLVRLETSSTRGIYQDAYGLIRDPTAGHQNAFFDVIDRALSGPNAARDARILSLLDQWLQRPSRDQFVDLHGKVAVCGSEACDPVPVPLRPPTDFIWQRDPFQLTGGTTGVVETAGIDYILPYWMARYYGAYSAFTVQSAAAGSLTVTPNSLASIFGSNLPGGSVTVKDAAGIERPATVNYTSPQQINFVIPNGTAPGVATFSIQGSTAPLTTTGNIQAVAPTLFSMSGNGIGVAAATAAGTQAIPVFQCDHSGCVATPINLGVNAPVYLSLYGTGIRNRSSLSNVSVTIAGVNVPVLYAGPQLQYEGLDQVNVQLPPSLRGSGESNVLLTVDGHTANAVIVNLK
ncbi:MAG: hypothetical protein LAP38_03720 [Acidobacteriia bacterium]|nr:hypothetical protein [Terriglobia bacterium]